MPRWTPFPSGVRARARLPVGRALVAVGLDGRVGLDDLVDLPIPWTHSEEHREGRHASRSQRSDDEGKLRLHRRAHRAGVRRRACRGRRQYPGLRAGSRGHGAQPGLPPHREGLVRCRAEDGGGLSDGRSLVARLSDARASRLPERPQRARRLRRRARSERARDREGLGRPRAAGEQGHVGRRELPGPPEEGRAEEVTGEARIVRGTVPITLENAYTLILPPSAPPRGGHPLLVALHGYGDDGARLRERLAELEPAPYALLYPDGPYPVEVRDQWPPRLGYAWYQYTGDQDAFVAALDRTSAHLAQLLAAVARTQPIDTSRVAMLGYSQGGYLAGVMALKNHARYRGLVAIACRIKVEALTEVLPHAGGFEVLVLHGTADESVKLAPQQLAIETLRQHGVAVDFQIHPGGHGLRRELVPRIDAFVRRVLGCAPRSA